MTSKYLLILIILNIHILAQSPLNKSSSIPFSVREVKEVSKILDGDVLLYDDAVYNKVMEKIEDYDIVHFSSHVKIDFDKELSSKILLHGTKDLFLSEIYSLNLKAKLAVLSGCNTGIGKLHSGEGVMSFARAFRFAGCSSILMTLWAVDDYATSNIIVEFYKYLFAGKPKDVALQQAKIKYLNKSNGKTASPVFWAAPVVVGNPNKIIFKEKRVTPFSTALIFTIVVIFLSLLFILTRKPKSNS